MKKWDFAVQYYLELLPSTTKMYILFLLLLITNYQNRTRVKDKVLKKCNIIRNIWENWLNRQTFFLKLSFANQGPDVINLGNILHHKSVKSKIPILKISLYNLVHIYTTHIATKILNYKNVLQDLNTDNFKDKSPHCTCAGSSFIYNSANHVIVGDLNIINNTSLRDRFAKGPKYREPKSIHWKYNSKIIMDSVEKKKKLFQTIIG